MNKRNKTDIIPNVFKLQWHITERCNFRCKHCYQEKYDTLEMSLGQMENVIKQFCVLVKKWNISASRSFLSITGGEPFLHKDFFRFLSIIYNNSAYYRWGLMSNGSLVNRENAKILKLFKIEDFQLSLEGLEEKNDEIRGKGNFQKIFSAVKILNEAGIYPGISLTLTKENMKDIFSLAGILFNTGVKALRVRRLVPWGRGSQLVDSLLEPKDLLEIYRGIEAYDENLFLNGSFFRLTPGCENNFLWARQSKGSFCSVSDGRILALLPNGDVYPCRRLPIKIGNVFESSLEEIYFSEKSREIRDVKCEKAPRFCQNNCSNFNRCLGGAKCVTYAYSGRLNIPDVQCWRAYDKLDKKIYNIKKS